MTEETESAMNPVVQFLLLVVILAGCMFAGALLGMGFAILFYGVNIISEVQALNLNAPNMIPAFWMIQIGGATLALFSAPVIFAKYVVKEPKTYLKTSFNNTPYVFLLVFAIMFMASPFMEFLVNANQKMQLPESLHWLQQWMRNKEDEGIKATQALTQMKNVWQMLFVLLEVGLLTAIAEEFLFRGCVQTIFTRMTKNPHWGIWISAILFSAFHDQFFGFLPRMVLGVFFGYFVLWSGSIWTSVWAHFINNGTVVVVTYLYQQKKITVNPDDQHVFNYGAYAFSLIITVFLFLIYRKVTEKKQLPVL